MALHEQSVGATDEWYTPPHVFEAMRARFDVDVASPGRDATPWIPATHFITRGLDGLRFSWDRAFVWMNPPFGGRNGIVPWLERFVAHGNGVALAPDLTSAPWWQRFAPAMDLLLFVSPKIRFIDAHGNPGNSPAQGTCLMALGDAARLALCSAERSGLGVLVEPLWQRDRE